VVPVQAGGHDPQLEQIRGVQARLDEGAGTLEPIRQDIGQEWAGQPPAEEVHHLPQGIQHRNADDGRLRPPPASSGVGQNLAAAAMLLRAMPEPSTTEGRRIRESSRISWRAPRSDGPRAPPLEGRGTPRNIAPRLPDSCGKPRSCHTRISGHQDPGANIITRCAGTKSHTYDESWHRIECHNFTI
jgi:hypothetical protein